MTADNVRVRLPGRSCGRVILGRTSFAALAIAACAGRPASPTSEANDVQGFASPDHVPAGDTPAPIDAAVATGTAPSDTAPSDDPLRDGFATTEVDGARFGIDGRLTEYRRGELRAWIASVPAAEARAVARRVRGRGAFAMELDADPDSGVARVHSFVNHIADRIDDGGFPPATTKLTWRAALDERARYLTEVSDGMVRSLRKAASSSEAAADGIPFAYAHRPAAVQEELRRVRKLPRQVPLTDETLRAHDAKALAARNRELEAWGHPPITTVALVILDVPDTVALQLVMHEADDSRPTDQQASVVLASWRERYGARLVSNKLDVEVTRPPRTLAEARRAALELYLMCPAHPNGYATHRLSASELIEQVTSTYWECNWFVE
jgi:Domain of unknown function (DUF4253)